ncbi:hypothetical protein BU25DRAFT_411928 [Macroventuria anomochaeta]|uniref:Uncharacterized protein n=1 Tax=Macroventuria anomochaeta TaxID=301207 RepID=A0ACB6RY70_9PLEO|nr:uncharacterized protein BU25DRAFT_411928 [Macroventuria anomochaeta]KAF2626093.1 hypothetical protein BU25DRAFT_411928 [Macroventuria anomochaeta]
MAPTPHLIHSANSLSEASSLWYPIICDLGWNRSEADGSMHYHAALDGKTWLLITPRIASSASDNSGSEADTGSGSVSSSAKPQGCVVALPYPNGTGWIGFFIMSEAYRGKGLGGKLWRSMEKVWEQECVEVMGLDGVEEQVPTYLRRGFVDVGRIPLMVCLAEDVAKSSADAKRKEGYERPAGEFEDISKANREDLAALDLAHTGLDRSRYWVTSNLLDRDDGFGYIHYTDSEPTGFILVRGCEDGHRIGPLYAPSSVVATHLLRLVMQHPSVAESTGSLVAEVFGTNVEGKKVFGALGWKDTGVEYHRMWYKGKVPEEQGAAGLGTKGMFAIFDAACG